jgi:pyruvyltransferase
MGPSVVERQVDASTRSQARGRRKAGRDRLLSIGSIMHMAKTDDTVWGTGVNGKVADSAYTFERLDIRAVRGPLTRQWLSARGIDAPAIYGDPALLVPALFPEFTAAAQEKRHRLTIVPNFHDYPLLADAPEAIDPRGDFREVITRIVQSERVIASSLHGVILAEAFGVPVVALKSSTEPPFKYNDYFEGTGRTDVPIAESLSTAERLLKSQLANDKPLSDWSAEPLQRAFPTDLWR